MTARIEPRSAKPQKPSRQKSLLNDSLVRAALGRGESVLDLSPSGLAEPPTSDHIKNQGAPQPAARTRKGEQAFKDEVNQALAALDASGEADKIFAKWFGPETVYGMKRDFKIAEIKG